MCADHSLEKIHRTSTHLVELLSAATPESIGPAFCAVASDLRCYISYIANYPCACSALAEASTRQFWPERMKSIQCLSPTNVPLEALLIMPVQRLPRYSCFLRMAYTPAVCERKLTVAVVFRVPLQLHPAAQRCGEHDGLTGSPAGRCAASPIDCSRGLL
jgi:hypothetical protein